MTRRQDLSLKAKLYMALPFRLAIKGLKYFMANSEKTRGELLEHTRRDASVALYRPDCAQCVLVERGRPRNTKYLAVAAADRHGRHGRAA